MIKPFFLLPTTVHLPYYYWFWHGLCAAIKRSRFTKEACASNMTPTEVCFRNVLTTTHANHTSRTHQAYTIKNHCAM